MQQTMILIVTVTTVVNSELKIYRVKGTVEDESDVSKSLKLRSVGLRTSRRGG